MFMKAFFQSFCFLLLSGLGFISLHAQTPTQVIIANGGVFGPSNLVRMAAWNLATGQYQVFDSIPARSVQHVLIHNRDAFVCADSFLVRYNLDNLQREAITMIQGVRQTAVYQDRVIVAKGYGAVGSYLEIRHAADLSPDYGVTGLSGECEGIVVHNDTAYVAEPLFFGALAGKLAVVSLQNHLLEREIDLDSNGRIIKNLYLADDKIFSVNQISYFGSYGVISEYDLGTGSLAHHRVDLPTSQGAGIFDGKLYAAFGGGIGGWDISTHALADTNLVSGYWAAMALDSVNQRFYVTETDYATYGKLYSYSWAGVLLDSVDIGVSPEAIAVDYNISTAAERPQLESVAGIRTFPQPFATHVTVDLRTLPSSVSRLEVTDIAGKLLMTQTISGNRLLTLETSDFPAGTYLLRVYAQGQPWTTRMVKWAE
jgi:hypothetical protein